jgi:hypothetical protein
VNQIERLVEDFLAREDRSREWFAKQMGVNGKTLSSWFRRERRSPLPAGALKAIARVTRVPYRTVLDAALADAGYLPASAVVDTGDLDAKVVEEFFGTEPVETDLPLDDDSPADVNAG